jgi:hypothetical protein
VTKVSFDVSVEVPSGPVNPERLIARIAKALLDATDSFGAGDVSWRGLSFLIEADPKK